MFLPFCLKCKTWNNYTNLRFCLNGPPSFVVGLRPVGRHFSNPVLGMNEFLVPFTLVEYNFK